MVPIHSRHSTREISRCRGSLGNVILSLSQFCSFFISYFDLLLYFFYSVALLCFRTTVDLAYEPQQDNTLNIQCGHLIALFCHIGGWTLVQVHKKFAKKPIQEKNNKKCALFFHLSFINPCGNAMMSWHH